VLVPRAAVPPLALVAVGVVGLAELVLVFELPPHAARPTASAKVQMAARIRRCMRLTVSPLT